ncbi:MAG: disulfide bond formation protein B [bacterium]|nr:disulfide bond formation protein B [bacterium]
MESFTENLNTFASIGTIAGHVFILAVLVTWLFARFGKNSPSGKWGREVLAKIGSYGLALGFLVALASVIISLVYSDIIGYEPCKFCWIQRIFLYPQVIILGLALWKKTKDAITYCLALSFIGTPIAAYLFYGQSFNPNALPACGVTGETSCAVRYFVEFGYITIPLMSLTAFILIIVSLLLAKSAEKN